MQVEWYGQSAFRLSTPEQTVVIDPFGDLSQLAGRGIQFDYPAIEGVSADLLLVTHEHADHNGVDVVGGDPVIIRSTAGRLESPVGEVTAIASEHDESAGTERGPDTIFVFALEGVRMCHFGDFGQHALREEQAAALGRADALPHAAHQLPRDRGSLSRACRARRAPRADDVRDRRPPDAGLAARGGAGGAVASPRGAAGRSRQSRCPFALSATSMLPRVAFE
jgi:Beta-lactamase superfamily domain